MFQKQFSLRALGAVFAMALGAATGGAQAEFKVLRGPENTLRYIKDPCAESDTVSSFFLHVFPVSIDDLSVARGVFGFDNLDFSFKKKGILLKGACFATVQLPDYEIDSIETGQKKSEDQLWKVKITQPRGAKHAQPSASRVGKVRQYTLRSHLYRLNVQIIQLERFAATGGAIAALHNELLVATPRGKFAMIGVDYAPRRLTGRVPMNESAFVYHETQNDPVFKPLFFRVVDVLLKERGANRFDLFVSHSYFTGECVVLRLSASTLSRENGRFEVSPSWRTVFDAKPCLSSSTTVQRSDSISGGILMADGPDHLLLTVGDFGINKGGLEPQNPDVHLGKIMRIAIETGQAEAVSQGHRNPGGLARDRNGSLWMTEHGPKGGDELNLIQKGNDYGWPLVSYGIDSNGKKLPRSERPLGSHDRFARPVFAWVPSIGVSNLVVNDEQALPLWKDDLLVASLKKGRSIFRIRHHNQKVDYVERIRISASIRDITHASGGRLALLNDSHSRVLILQRSE